MWATKPLIPPKGNLKVTTYYDILDIQLLCCLKDDSAPMHKVSSLKKWLSKSFLEEPDYAAQSPDLYPFQTNTQPTFTCIHLHTKTYHMTPSHSHTNMHISIIPPNSPQKHLLSSCHTLRVTDPYCAIKFIFLVPIDNLIYSIWLCGSLSPDLGWEKRRNHSIMTFYGFIPLQQWCCHPEMAPVCHLVQGSACFMLMTEISRWFA